MKRRRTDRLYQSRCGLLSCGIQDVPDEPQESDQVRYIVLTGVHNPGPQRVVKERLVRHLNEGQELGPMLIHIKGVHGQMNTATPERRNEIFGA